MKKEAAWGKKGDISSRHSWFPSEKTSAERTQIWVVPLIVRTARKICLNQSEALPRSEKCSVSISDIMPQGNQCWRLKMTAVLSG